MAAPLLKVRDFVRKDLLINVFFYFINDFIFTLTELLPEVIATACSKCNKIQRANVRKSVKAIQDKKPDKFEEIRKKYDPKGEYEQAFIDFLVGTDK